jgi:hypothetical protein
MTIASGGAKGIRSLEMILANPLLPESKETIGERDPENRI